MAEIQLPSYEPWLHSDPRTIHNCWCVCLVSFGRGLKGSVNRGQIDKGGGWMQLMLYLQKEHGPLVLLGQLSEVYIYSKYSDL